MARPLKASREACIVLLAAVSSAFAQGLADPNAHAMALEEYYDLVGLKEQAAREESYDRAAAAVVAKRAAE